MPYVVFAEIRVKGEHLAAAREAVRGILAETRSEHGCEMFGLHEAADGSPRLFIYERWTDRAAFDFHHAQPYTQRVYAHYADWLAEPPILTELLDVL